MNPPISGGRMREAVHAVATPTPVRIGSNFTNRNLATEEEALMKLAMDMSMASEVLWNSSDTNETHQAIRVLETVLYVYLRDSHQNIEDVLGYDIHGRIDFGHLNTCLYDKATRLMQNNDDIVSQINWQNVESVISKLQASKERIIQYLSNPKDDNLLIVLLELNESVASILFKVETFLSASITSALNPAINKSSASESVTYELKLRLLVPTVRLDMSEIIRRLDNGDEIQTAEAISSVIMMLNINNVNDRQDALKMMWTNGLIEILLQNISRFSDWTEYHLDIRAVTIVCALVAVCDDNNYLAKNMDTVLSLIYMLQLNCREESRRELEETLLLFDDDVPFNSTRMRANSYPRAFSNIPTEFRKSYLCARQFFRMETRILVGCAIARLSKVFVGEYTSKPFHTFLTNNGLESLLNIICVVNDGAITSSEVINLSKHRDLSSVRSCDYSDLSFYYSDFCSPSSTDFDELNRIGSLCCVAIHTLVSVVELRKRVVAFSVENHGSILTLLRQWFERGSKHLKIELSLIQTSFDDLASTPSMLSSFTILSDQSSLHDLISNSSQSAMLLVGGAEFTGYYHSSTPVHSKTHSEKQSASLPVSSKVPPSLLDNVTVQFIDSKFVSSGVLDAIVNFLAVAVQVHNLIENFCQTEIALPKNISMALTQCLFQLSSRPPNRAHMSSISAPLVLCEVFCCIVADNKASNKLLRISSAQNFGVDSLGRYTSMQEDEGSLRSSESSTISSSLDALAFFLNDAATSAALAASLDVETLNPSEPSTSHDMLLIERMSARLFVDALKFIIALAPQSNVRLSCLRVVEILTEWHRSIKSVAESDLPTALIKIISDSDEIHNMYEKQFKIRSSMSDTNSLDGSIRESRGSFSPATTTNPTSVTPGSATILTSPPVPKRSGSGFSFGFSAPASSRSSTGTAHVEPQIRNNSWNNLGNDSSHEGSVVESYDVSTKMAKYDSGYSEEINSPNALSSEELILAMGALANIAHANQSYADILFGQGLLDLSLMLMDSRRVEISHHSIQCVVALCSVVANLTPNNRSDDGIKGKLDLCREALRGCAKALNYPHALPADRKYALIGISELTQTGHQVIDDIICEEIVHGPLEAIVAIMLNHELGNRDLKVAAEEVLKNIGFQGGMDDLGTCFYSLDLLIDWFKLKQSTVPQRRAWAIIRQWLQEFFRAYDENAIWNIQNISKSLPGNVDFASEVASSMHLSIFESSGGRIMIGSAPSPENVGKHIAPRANIRKNIGGILKALPYCFGIGQAQAILKEEEHEAKQLSLERPSLFDTFRSALSSGSSTSDKQQIANYNAKILEWLDHIPQTTLNLFDIFHVSRLAQLVMMDITTLGLYDSSQLSESNQKFDLPYLLPKTSAICALLLPSRLYSGQTFSRSSRFIEKIVNDDINCKQWALSFRDSEFYGDFNETLLSTLNKCPRIIALNFSGPKIEAEAHLGHLGGRIPSTIRYLSFRACLSGESIQALCILLRKQNAVFVEMSSKDLDLLSKSILSKAVDGLEEFNQGSVFRSTYDELARSRPLKGLTCLAITHSNVYSKEIEYLVNLLSIFPKSAPVGGRGNSGDRNLNVLNNHKRGLRYLDLSFNRFNDHDCSELLKGAVNGPLEGLDLSGNSIGKGHEFANTLESFLKNAVYPLNSKLSQAKTTFPIVYLRHLSISNNNIPSKTLNLILNALQLNETLTSLDISYNQIHKDDHQRHISATRDAVREFVKNNKTLRILDVSHMNLKREIISALQLGLLENESLLLIPMVGNPAEAEITSTVQRLRTKLAQNRVKYQQSTVVASDSALLVESVDQIPSLPPKVIEKTSNHSPVTITPTSSAMNTLYVMFSSPLAWRDQTGKIHSVEMLDYSCEREDIVQVLREVQRDISVNFNFATTETLRTALSLSCRALHFSGHGHQSFLTFEDGNSGMQLMKSAQLVNLLTAGGNLSLQFVFVSACHSRNMGQAFVDAGVPHVVCCRVDEMIQDSAAIAFTRAFYVALLAGSSVRQAFEIGREALKVSARVSNSEVEGEKFILLPENADHDVSIFSCPVVSSWPLAGRGHVKGRGFTASSWLTAHDSETGLTVVDNHDFSEDASYFLHTLPAPPPDFEGREADMYRVITSISVKRHVTLVGECGVGKSAVISAVCNYIADRGLFSDGVLFTRILPTANTVRALVASLLHSIASEAARQPTSALYLRLQSCLATYQSGSLMSVNDLALLTSTARASHLSSSLADSTSDESNSQPNSRPISLSRGLTPTYVDDSRVLSYEQQEELLVTCLAPLRVLLVIEDVEILLPRQRDSNRPKSGAKELRSLLSQIYEHCRFVKVLVSSTETLRMRSVQEFGVVEASVTLGPLTLRSSLRLFAKLAQPLQTSVAKGDFIRALTPNQQENVTTSSADISIAGARILALFGNGHPGRIVRIASQATAESVAELLKNGQRAISLAYVPVQHSFRPRLPSEATEDGIPIHQRAHSDATGLVSQDLVHELIPSAEEDNSSKSFAAALGSSIPELQDLPLTRLLTPDTIELERFQNSPIGLPPMRELSNEGPVIEADILDAWLGAQQRTSS